MGRWLTAVLVVPLLVVTVLAVMVVRSQNESYARVVSSTEVASLAARINDVDEALGAEALAGRLVIADPALWPQFESVFVGQTDQSLVELDSLVDDNPNPGLEQAIDVTNAVLAYRVDMQTGVVSPLQLADRYSIPRTQLLDVLRNSEQQAALQRLIALIEARSAHLDERFATELALTYGTWAPGQYSTATGAITIQGDRIRSTEIASSDTLLVDDTQLASYREQIQLTSEIPEISPEEFAVASNVWLDMLNAEIDREATEIAALLDAQVVAAGQARWLTMGGVAFGVLIAFLTAGLISYRIVGRVGAIAQFAQRFANEDYGVGLLSDVVTGHDELADLAVIFDEMAGEVRQRDRRLEAQAQIDYLTGILNRKAVISRWALLLERTSGSAFAFAMDLDGFKPINDRYGHHAGDQVLVEVANRLLVETEPYRAVVGRIGGDEFLVVFDDPAVSSSDPVAIAEALLGSVRQPIAIDGATVSVNATIGIVRSRTDGTSATQLLRDADAALYVAKTDSPGGALESNEALRSRLADMDVQRKAVRDGIENEEFEPWFQSIWSADGQLVGFEALARWRSANGEVRGTSSFMDVAEDQRLLHLLDAQILRSTCLMIAAWSAGSLQPPMVSVNISTGFLEQHGFVSTVKDLIDELGFDPSALILEVSESGLMTDASSNADRLQQLRDLGVRISVDDYGTGYSSLSYLRQLPIDFVKLDRQFVSSVDTNYKNQAIARSVVALTSDLGMQSIIEGVERAEEHAWLIANGADYLQGYFLGAPVDAIHALKLLEDEVLQHERRAV